MQNAKKQIGHFESHTHTIFDSNYYLQFSEGFPGILVKITEILNIKKDPKNKLVTLRNPNKFSSPFKWSIQANHIIYNGREHGKQRENYNIRKYVIVVVIG